MILAEQKTALRGCTVQNNVRIGYKSYANDSFIGEKTEIGRFCSIGRRCSIGAVNHHVDWLTTHPVYHDPQLKPSHLPARGEMKRSTKIGNDVWIGDNAVIIEGLSIGDGAIVAAGAVVTKDVAPYTIVGGVPARPIRSRLEDVHVERLLGLQWWQYAPSILRDIPFNEIGRSIDLLHERALHGHPVMPPHHKPVRRDDIIGRRRSWTTRLWRSLLSR